MNRKIILENTFAKYKQSSTLQNGACKVRKKAINIKEIKQSEAITILGKNKFNSLSNLSKARYVEVLKKIKEKYVDFTKVPQAVFHYILEYSSYPKDYPMSNLPRFINIYEEFVKRKKREPKREEIIDFLKYSRHPEFELSKFFKLYFGE